MPWSCSYPDDVLRRMEEIRRRDEEIARQSAIAMQVFWANQKAISEGGPVPYPGLVGDTRRSESPI